MTRLRCVAGCVFYGLADVCLGLGGLLMWVGDKAAGIPTLRDA